MKFIVYTSFLVLTLSGRHLLVSALSSNQKESPQDISHVCNSASGRTSQCKVQLDVPSACVSGGSQQSECPVVFFLHGAGGTINFLSKTSGVHEAEVIGVYPQGEDGWNTGPKSNNDCSWDDFECTTDPDEGAFIASIISEVRSQGASGNIYVIGSSNGAALANKLAANGGDELPIKGIVTKVSQLLSKPERSGPGVLNYNQPSVSRNTPKVSVLNIMGTKDGLIPYSGGTSGVFGGDTNFALMGALESMEKWAAHNGCEVVPFDNLLPSTLGDEAIFYDYKGCDEGKIVEHYAIVGGGHDAGGTDIDGVSVSDISFDFIKRVESDGSTRAPTVAPLPTITTNTPTKAPSPEDDTGGCVDDSSWVGKLNDKHTCSFVANISNRRACGMENSAGVKASVACPSTCDANCDSVVTNAPTISPGGDGPNCVNDSSWVGKNNDLHTCAFIAGLDQRACVWENSAGIKAKEACAEFCNPNCGSKAPTANKRKRKRRRQRKRKRKRSRNDGSDI